MESRAKAGKKTKPVYIAGIIALIGGWLLLHGTVIDDIIFPLGMSFYTFQAISYLTDVYWQEQRSERNWVDFLIYMLFFMKFLSGPIERGGDLLPQLKDPRPFIYSNAVTGLKYILLIKLRNLLLFKSPPQCSGSVAIVNPFNLSKTQLINGLSLSNISRISFSLW